MRSANKSKSVSFRFFIALNIGYAKSKGYVDGDGNVNGTAVAAECKRLADRLQRAFDKFFNPKKGQGEWKLYEFPPCCSFHIDAEFSVSNQDWTGKSIGEVRAALAEGEGVIEINKNSTGDHAHADIGGQGLVLKEDDILNSTFPHEIGHLLGLPDMYHTDDIPGLGVKGNKMTPEEEKAHIGELMGKRKPGGFGRSISDEEIGRIAEATGMTCDRATCCPIKKQAHPLHGQGKRDADAPSPREGVKTELGCVYGAPMGAVVDLGFMPESDDK